MEPGGPHRHRQVDMDGVALIGCAARLAGLPEPLALTLLHRAGVLDRSGRLKPPEAGCSRLCVSGMPLQVCISASERHRDAACPIVRLVIDPDFDLSAAERCARVRRRLTVRADGVPGVRALAATQPWLDTPVAGPLWFAVTLTAAADREDMVLYLNTELFGEPIWATTRQRLDAMLPRSEARDRLLRHAQDCSTPLCLALEFSASGAWRTRLHLRPHGPGLDALAPFARQHLVSSAMLEAIGAERVWPGSGVTLALGLDSRDGAPDGAELDLCLCARCRRLSGARADLERRLSALVPDAEPLFDVGELAFASTSGDGKEARTSLYFEPRLA